MPKTTLNKVNLALTGVFCVMLAGNIYMKSVLSAYGIPDCPPNSNGEIVLIPNPEDCSTYFECIDGQPVLRDCPDGLYYCEEKQHCTWEWDNDCAFDCGFTGGSTICYIPGTEDRWGSALSCESKCKAYREMRYGGRTDRCANWK
ncbi:MAG: carbohydrate-binding module family 14 protein [Rikenellaceae bacterium]|nr:carbohydrate-binding module family 14 protein [Rikenellaceae bacterium]MCL2693001.1 carbohydrate-binding module family 14 protein [Rikenellaceae bacterium]